MAALAAISLGWSNLAGASVSTGHKHNPPHHSSLSGKWSGSYGGTYSGTFRLTWQQSGQNLSGTIRVSGFNNALTSLHGTVQGASIRFGTVGSEAITYTGSVSGKSMSGTWKIKAGSRTLGGGSWRASKSS
ncbi:MAG: hypothetical protein WB770_09530 [Acidimicrobiales bacterium]